MRTIGNIFVIFVSHVYVEFELASFTECLTNFFFIFITF